MNKKIIIKTVGNIVTLVAIVFVVKQLFSSGIDYRGIFSVNNIIPIITIIFSQAVLVLLNSYPWATLVTTISEKRIDYMDIIEVYTKSNIYKYVPGNVFQYIGRNELASKRNIPHIKVAIATFLDVICNVISAFALSLFFLYDFTIKYIGEIDIKFILILMIFFLVCITVIIVMKERIVNYLIEKNIRFTRKYIYTFFKCFLYYIFSMIITSLMYCIVVFGILKIPISFNLFINLFSAYILSWLVGFITPGAPAGIGIKEAVMVAVTGGLLNQPSIALSMIIIRILTTISDFIAYLIVSINRKLCKNNYK